MDELVQPQCKNIHISFSKRVGIVAIEEGQPTNGNSEFDQREENVNTTNNNNNVSGSGHVRR